VNTKQVRRTLQDVRRELDEAAENIDRLERALADIESDGTPALVGAWEVLQLTGLKRSAFMQRIKRGTVPEPVVHLECGRIWRLADIERWWQAQ
jgi:predicted DNA-binding transcriptional regulator AlpA